MFFIFIILLTFGYSSAQFFMPWYLNETKELMDIDVNIVRGMTKPYAKSQIRQVINDTYLFYCKLGDVCDMIESYDDTGFRIYDEFMHLDQVAVLKMGPHCTALEFNETELLQKYNWTQKEATELMMNVKGIFYEWNKLKQLRATFIITTTTTTTTTTTPTPTTEEPLFNDTLVTERILKKKTRSPRSTGKTRGTYRKRTSTLKSKHKPNISKDTSQSSA